jgi:oligopeptidase B
MSFRLVALTLAACAAAPQPQPSPAPAAPGAPRPPIARREPHPTTIHGRKLEDDYFWLRQKGTPAVESYLQAENAYTLAVMKPTQALQDTLYREMLARVQEDDATVPHRKNGWYYYKRTEKGKQYPIFCRKRAGGAAKDDLVGATATAPEQVMLDLNQLGQGKPFISLGPHAVSDDGRTLAYAIDETGFRQFTLFFRDLATGRVAAESIPRVDAVAWAADDRTVFYVVEDPVTKRPDRLVRHTVGTDPRGDRLVYEEKDEMFELDLARTRSGAYLVATSESKTTTEVRVLDARRPDADWQVIEPRRHDHMYFVDHRGAELLILTNWLPDRKAVNFRLVSTPITATGRANWKELVAHRDDVMLEGFDVFADHVVLHERADALPRFEVLHGAALDTVPMPEALYEVSPDANEELDAPAFRFHFESPVTPDTVYDYDFKTRQLTQRKRVVVPGFDPARYQSARTHAKASDGTRIPISLVYRKGLPAGPKPMLLYGYGSYGIPMSLPFESENVSLLDRGVVFAVAHIRGGGDLGKPWHEGGRMATKMNTFTDFIACGEELERSGWTAPDRVVIMGGSAGGLLMGAVTNLRPDLWKGVVAQVPFVDVINTMLDESLPLTVSEFEEWGNPKQPEEFEWIAGYSPYDNLARKDYPAMLVESSYNDSQVMYWEPAKYVARLRAVKTDGNPLLLMMRMDPAGHGGRSGRYNRLREAAFTYAWILGTLGIRA